LKAKADAVVRTYDRETWIRLALVFFPVPFVVVLVRLHIPAWGYYVAGGFLIVSAALLVHRDGRAAAKRDRAVAAAERARQAYDEARIVRDAP
jgi:hypothetical protein